MEDDVIGTESTIKGHGTRTCDLCGRPVVAGTLRTAMVDQGGGGAVEQMRLCRSCFEASESEEVPFDAEVDAGLWEADN